MANQIDVIFVDTENRTKTEKLVNSVLFKSIKYCDIQAKPANKRTEEDLKYCQKFMMDMKYIVATNYDTWLEVQKIMCERAEKSLKQADNLNIEFIRKSAVKCQKETLGKNVSYTDEEESLVKTIQAVKAFNIVAKEVNDKLNNEPDCPKNNRICSNFDRYVNNYNVFNNFNFLYRDKTDSEEYTIM